jgi:hypothetical protein
MLQLRDGRILVHEDQGGNARNWWILTPDSTGSYLNGTWSSGGSMPANYAPFFFSSQVLLDGKHVLIEGGEYNLGTQVWTTLGAYGTCTPFGSCTWVNNAPPSGWTRIGDAQSVLLANGKYLQASCCSAQTALFNGPGSWTLASNTKNYNDEQAFTLLPSGKLLTVDAWQNPACSNSLMATELRDPTAGTWSCGPQTTSQLWDNSGHELGPAVLMYNNKVIVFGAVPSSSIYNVATNTWSAGPTPSAGLDAADAPAALEPNGKVLAMLSPGEFHSGCQMVEYNPSTDTLANTANPPPCPLDSSFVGHLMVLPTGQIMFTDFSTQVYLYTPASGVVASAVPTITGYPTNITHGVTGYSLMGTQLNGLTQNNAYGDDYQADTNFPLVYITNGTHKYFLPTHDDSTHSIAPGTVVTTKFDVPSTVPPGNYQIAVVANGIRSTSHAITVH